LPLLLNPDPNSDTEQIQIQKYNKNLIFKVIKNIKKFSFYFQIFFTTNTFIWKKSKFKTSKANLFLIKKNKAQDPYPKPDPYSFPDA